MNNYKLQISAFFLLSNFPKGRLLYMRPVGQLVGWSVGQSVGVTINFPSPNCVTQPHTDKIPPFTIHYHSLLTQYHHVPAKTILYWPSTTKYQLFLQILSKHQNTNERFALFTGSSLIIESSLHLYWHSVYLASASFHPHYNHGFHHRQSNLKLGFHHRQSNLELDHLCGHF